MAILEIYTSQETEPRNETRLHICYLYDKHFFQFCPLKEVFRYIIAYSLSCIIHISDIGAKKHGIADVSAIP